MKKRKKERKKSRYVLLQLETYIKVLCTVHIQSIREHMTFQGEMETKGKERIEC